MSRSDQHGWMMHTLCQVLRFSGDKVVEPRNIIPHAEEMVGEVGADEAGSAGD